MALISDKYYNIKSKKKCYNECAMNKISINTWEQAA